MSIRLFNECGKPPGGQVSTRCGSVPIIISQTGIHLVFGILQGKEPVVVQPFLSKLSVESFDWGVARGFSRPAEIQLHPLQICKLVQALGDKSGTVISRMVWESWCLLINWWRISTTPASPMLAAF